MSYDTSLLDEQWKPVVGWEDIYRISSAGRIRSITRILPDGRTVKGKMLSPSIRGSGYIGLNLSRDKVRKGKYIHRLVLEAFVGPCPDGMEARHLNGNPHDNRVENLAWGTPSENTQDTIRHGNHHGLRKTHCPNGHPLVKKASPRGMSSRKCVACQRAHALTWRRPEFLPHFDRISDIYYDAISDGIDTSVSILSLLDKEFPGVRSDAPARYSGRKTTRIADTPTRRSA